VPRPLLLTPGEPAGIGPEIACRLAAGRPGLVLVADPGLIERTLERLALKRSVGQVTEPGQVTSADIACLPVELARIERPGQLDPANAPYVLECLGRAADLCLSGQAAGLVTGPVHKGIINAGIVFSGTPNFWLNGPGWSGS
jgi:4-hydroxythreonine-4-phosphate dehydrogenase